MSLSKFRRALLCAVLGVGLFVPAFPQDDEDWDEELNPDPYEDTNRGIYAFNKAIDSVFLKPVAQGYRAIFPVPMRTAISNFFANLGEPLNLVNGALQGSPPKVATAAGRFFVNSTIGLAGFFDPATATGLPRAEEDFGQTIRRATGSSGSYLVLPIFGPSTTEDAIGLVGDIAVNSYIKRTIFDDDATENVLTAAGVVDLRARLLQAEEAVEDAIFDEYSFVRDAYLERRLYLTADEDQ